MKTKLLHAALAALLAAALATPPASAYQIAEVRGDFYYDAEGNLLGHRTASLPEGFERRPMSHKEKFQLMGLQLPERPTYLTPRMVFPKPARVDDRPELSRDKIIVKFVEGMAVRLRNGQLTTGNAALPQVEGILARYPDARLQRNFDVPEQVLQENMETGEQLSGKDLADLNNIYLFTFETPSQRGVDLANELLALDIVELAYLQAPGTTPGPCVDVAPATPSWVANQDYREAAPAGVDAPYAWGYHAGGDGPGPGYWVADLEWEWCYTHEDLNIDITDVLNGNSGANVDFMNHGTAVLGEISACANGWGVTGITPDIEQKMCDFDSEASWSANIAEADFWLISGETMLLEIHILGPDSGLACPCNCLQFEYVPVEWDFASWLAIQTATANGIIVVEAGGNGSMNLDSAIYGGWFNPGNDSGAIIVGAGLPGSHSPECWTNSGARVNVHAWGSSIYTTGYGFLFNQAGCNQDYDNGFGGTSGASPIIVGSAVALQGISQNKYGVTLSPGQIRTSLPQGGTPQGAPLTRNIGPMPNLINAINWIEPDVVASFAPAGWTFPAVPRAFNDSNGGSVPLQAGALPGNVFGTYWNWNEQNPGYSYVPTVSFPNCAIGTEDTFFWQCFNGNLAPNTWTWCGNTGPDFVKGGRHTVLARADWQGLESEWHEGNNDWARQYIWSPLPLAINGPVVRSYDPAKNSTGSGPYFNAEGFSGTTSTQYWYAFAIMPADASTDHDIYLNTEVPLNIPQQGFGATVAQSGSGGDYSDFVVVDLNTVAPGTYYASGINWAGTGNKVVEFDMDQGVVSNPGINGPYTLGAGEIVDLHEIFLNAAVPTRIQIQWLDGDANFGVTVHNSATGFTDKWTSIAGGYSDTFGPREDESVVVQAGVGDWHSIAVWKRNSPELGQFVTYNLIVSQLPNLTNATPSGWYGPVVPRNTTDANNFFAPLPPTLNGNQTTTSYNFSTYNQGPGTVATQYQTHLFVDDFFSWIGFSAATLENSFMQWTNTSQGFDPNSLVRGGRHHIRINADNTFVIAELPETDNQHVDWFVWTPLQLGNQVPVVRLAPPVKDPVGWGPFFSNDGFRSAQTTYWTAVGVLPTSAAADYDMQLHNPSTGSKDGFGGTLAYSGDATDGAPDFSIVNYNMVGFQDYDYSAVNWNAATASGHVQQADAPFLTTIPAGVSRYGAFRLDETDVLDLWEVFVPVGLVGVPIHISLNNLEGNCNVDLRLYNGTVAYHTKFSAMGLAAAAGNGGDEHMAPVVFGASGFYAIAVHKNSNTDAGKFCRYELVFSTGGSAVDAPAVTTMPTAFALSTPRPNPFSRTTSIELAVPADQGKATVAIFDLQGRRITTVAESVEKAGRHLLTWDGRDSGGNEVSAGIYFVVLESPTGQETKKITLLR